MDAFEDYLPLWLELHFDDQAWLFELRAGEERAVVVGSHPTADVSIARDGIASTHFHFERERGGVVIVPGYRAALVIDQVPAPEPVAITKTARVEFCGALLEARVHDVPPLDMLLQARHGTDRMMRRPDYFDRLPEDTDPTVVALAAGAPPTRVAAGAEPDDDINLMTTTAWRAPASGSTPVGPQGTVIIPRPPTTAYADSTTAYADSTTAPPTMPPLPPIAPTARIRLEPWTSHTAASPRSSPTRVDVPRPRGSVPLARAGEPPVAPPLAEIAQTHSLAPTESAVAPVPKRFSAIAHLGMAASLHPFRVAMTALPICLVLALALVGAARLTGRYPAAKESGTARLQAKTPASTLAAASSSRTAAGLANVADLPPPVREAVDGRAPAASATAPTSSVASTSGPIPSRPKTQGVARPKKHVFLSK